MQQREEHTKNMSMAFQRQSTESSLSSTGDSKRLIVLASVCVTVRVSTAGTKHHDQKVSWDKKRVYLAYSSALLSITDGRQGRNSNRAAFWRQELIRGHEKKL